MPKSAREGALSPACPACVQLASYPASGGEEVGFAGEFFEKLGAEHHPVVLKKEIYSFVSNRLALAFALLRETFHVVDESMGHTIDYTWDSFGTMSFDERGPYSGPGWFANIFQRDGRRHTGPLPCWNGCTGSKTSACVETGRLVTRHARDDSGRI